MGHRVQQPKHFMGISGKQLRENESENSPYVHIRIVDRYVHVYKQQHTAHIHPPVAFSSM